MNFWVGAGELVGEEIAFRIADELNKSHDHSPRMRAMAKDALEENFGHDFFECFILDCGKEIEEECTEPESVVAREAKVEYNSAYKMMLTYQSVR